MKDLNDFSTDKHGHGFLLVENKFGRKLSLVAY